MINNVTLVGRLTKNPELRYTPNGVAVASFTIAVNRSFTNQQGEREADFINCQTWRKQAENLCNYQKKGNLIGVSGSIQTRNYEGDNGRVWVTEVVAEQIAFLESKGNSSSNENKTNTGQSGAFPFNNQQSGYTRVDDDPFAGNGVEIDLDDPDGLPF